MPTLTNQRYTTHMDQPFVVFLIGMRVNNFFQFGKWLPAFRAMPTMMEVLHKDPEKGYLGGEFYMRLNPIQPLLMSYWRSFEDLERFARSKDDPHAAAWRQFNQSVGTDGSVGIWHETYRVDPGGHEAIYVNMPPFGLAKASGNIIPVGKGPMNYARQRMSAEAAPLPAELEV